MNNKQLSQYLSSIAQCDIDVARSYDQALRSFDCAEWCGDLTEFRDEHLEQVKNIGEFITQLGDEPPQYSPDLQGKISKGMQKIDSHMDRRGLFQRLVNNEQAVTERIYRSIDDVRIPEIVHDLEEESDDVRMHVDFLQRISPRT